MKKKKSILLFFIVFFAISFLLYLYFHISNNQVQKQESNTNTKSQKIIYKSPIPTLKSLYQNEDIVAEIEFPSLELKQPVVQGSDNEFYLTHNSYKNEDKLGAIFLDYRIVDINKAKQVNIYGHNSDYYTPPFRILENYQQEDFFNQHLDITLKTDKKAFSYKIFFVSIVPKGNNEHMIISYQGDPFLNHINLMRSNALFDTKEEITKQDDILILQTCLFNPEGRNLLIGAKKIKNKE